jgi:hypothetical protein
MNGTDTIRDYARLGVRVRLGEIQAQLEALYRDFPEEFTKKPHVAAGKPYIEAGAVPANGHRSRRHKARRRQVPSATIARAVKHATEKPWGTVAWQRIHDYLASQPKMTARAVDIRKVVKVSDPMVYSIVEKRPDLFERAEPGVFRLKQKAH